MKQKNDTPVAKKKAKLLCLAAEIESMMERGMSYRDQLDRIEKNFGVSMNYHTYRRFAHNYFPRSEKLVDATDDTKEAASDYKENIIKTPFLLRRLIADVRSVSDLPMSVQVAYLEERYGIQVGYDSYRKYVTSPKFLSLLQNAPATNAPLTDAKPATAGEKEDTTKRYDGERKTGSTKGLFEEAAKRIKTDRAFFEKYGFKY